MTVVSYTQDSIVNKFDISNYLATLDLFAGLSTNQIDALAKVSKLVNVDRGEPVFVGYELLNDFYLLLNGQIKISVTSLYGLEKVVCLIDSGQTFGEETLFIKESEYSLCAQAIIDCQVLIIPRDAILSILDSSATFARSMLVLLSERNCQRINEIKYISLQNSTQRLINFLLQRSQETSNEYWLQLPVNKQTIASMLNITPETFSRSMHRLINAGLIEVNGKEVYILNIEGLRSFK